MRRPTAGLGATNSARARPRSELMALPEEAAFANVTPHPWQVLVTCLLIVARSLLSTIAALLANPAETVAGEVKVAEAGGEVKVAEAGGECGALHNARDGTVGQPGLLHVAVPGDRSEHRDCFVAGRMTASRVRSSPRRPS